MESADKQPQVLTQWITSINDLHRSKPQPTVAYTHTMPSLDILMQAWPSELEDMLSKVMLPIATVDLDLRQCLRVHPAAWYHISNVLRLLARYA